MTRSRSENLAIIVAYTGLNETLDSTVQDAVLDNLGQAAFSDAAVALMASEYERLAQAKGFLATFDDAPGSGRRPGAH